MEGIYSGRVEWTFTFKWTPGGEGLPREYASPWWLDPFVPEDDMKNLDHVLPSENGMKLLPDYVESPDCGVFLCPGCGKLEFRGWMGRQLCTSCPVRAFLLLM